MKRSLTASRCCDRREEEKKSKERPMLKKEQKKESQQIMQTNLARKQTCVAFHMLTRPDISDYGV